MLAQPGLGAACVGLKRGMGGSQLVGSPGEQVFEDMLPHPTDLPSATPGLGCLILASLKDRSEPRYAGPSVACSHIE